MALSTIAAAALAALLLPLLLLWRLSLTPQQNARRLHRRGHSYRAIVLAAPSRLPRPYHRPPLLPRPLIMFNDPTLLPHPADLWPALQLRA